MGLEMTARIDNRHTTHIDTVDRVAAKDVEDGWAFICYACS